MAIHRQLIAIIALLVTAASFAKAETIITIGYLERVLPQPPVLSNLEAIPENDGLAGAELGLKDNQTTGRFLGQKYVLETRLVDEEGDVAAAARELLSLTPFIVINGPANDILFIADLPEAGPAVLFNAASRDIALRQQDCRRNVFHTSASRAMLADALAQFSTKRKWANWALIEGDHADDKAFTAALQKAAIKFGVKVVGKKTWVFDADMRRNAAQEVPLFTQDLR